MERVKVPSGSVVASILTVAGVLRLYRAGHHDLWLDEALSYHFVTSRSLQDILFSLPLTDPHPPLYYVLLHGWIGVAGRSELALRFPSVLFGTAAVGALYLLVDAVFDRETAILASLLMAVSPFYIRYAQEARMYTLAVFLTVLATYFLYRWVDSTRSRHRVGYVASAASDTRTSGGSSYWAHMQSQYLTKPVS